MNKTLCVAGMLLAVSASAVAQQSGSGFRTPLQKDAWGYVGLSGGESRFRNGCPVGLNCGNPDTAWRLYGGGKLREAIGFEVAYMDLGNLSPGAGADARGLNFSLLFGLPGGRAAACTPGWALSTA